MVRPVSIDSLLSLEANQVLIYLEFGTVDLEFGMANLIIGKLDLEFGMVNLVFRKLHLKFGMSFWNLGWRLLHLLTVLCFFRGQ